MQSQNYPQVNNNLSGNKELTLWMMPAEWMY